MFRKSLISKCLRLFPINLREPVNYFFDRSVGCHEMYVLELLEPLTWTASSCTFALLHIFFLLFWLLSLLLLLFVRSLVWSLDKRKFVVQRTYVAIARPDFAPKWTEVLSGKCSFPCKCVMFFGRKWQNVSFFAVGRSFRFLLLRFAVKKWLLFFSWSHFTRSDVEWENKYASNSNRWNAELRVCEHPYYDHWSTQTTHTMYTA